MVMMTMPMKMMFKGKGVTEHIRLLLVSAALLLSIHGRCGVEAEP